MGVRQARHATLPPIPGDILSKGKKIKKLMALGMQDSKCPGECFGAPGGEGEVANMACRPDLAHSGPEGY